MDRIKLLKTLELDAKAGAEDIERAYLELMKVWHPDRFQNDEILRAKAEDKTRQINQAYQALKKNNLKNTNTVKEETSLVVVERKSGLRPALIFIILLLLVYYWIGYRKQNGRISYEQNEFFSLKREVSGSARRKNQIKIEEGYETIKTPFIKTITECDKSGFDSMLAQGSNIEEKDSNGNSALIWAARRGCVDIVKTLIDRGVNVNQKSHNGFSPLMWANLYNRKEIEEMLVKAGSEPLPKYWDK